MPIPQGTIPLTGPVIDTTGALLTPSTTLRDVGALSLRGGRIRRVNQAGNGWEEVPGHVVSASEPSTGLFEGQIWYDTTNNALMTYNGSSFVAVSGAVVFGTASGNVAAWAEGDDTNAIPIAKMNAGLDPTAVPMRIRFDESSAGFPASAFTTGTQGNGTTEGTEVPITLPVGNRFIGLWIGTPRANILDIDQSGTSLVSNVFGALTTGTDLSVTIDGTAVAGTLFVTSSAININPFEGHIWRAFLSATTLADQIRDQVHQGEGRVETQIRREFAGDFAGLRPMLPLYRRTNTASNPGIINLGSPTSTGTTTNGFTQWTVNPSGWSSIYTAPASGNAYSWVLQAYQIRTHGSGWVNQFIYAVFLHEHFVTASVSFGSGAGQVSEIAEGNNTSPWPFNKIETGQAQGSVEIRYGWDTDTALDAGSTLTSTTGATTSIPDAPTGADRLWVAVLVDMSNRVRDIYLGNEREDVSTGFFNQAPTAVTFNSMTYQRWFTRNLNADEIIEVGDADIRVRLVPDNLDEHIDRRAEGEILRYHADNPVIEAITLTDGAFRTLNSAGTEVDLTWPATVLNQLPTPPSHGSEARHYNLRVPATSGDPAWQVDSGGAGADAQINALHAVSIAEHNSSSLNNDAANPGRAFDGDPSTRVSLASGANVLRGRVARTVYGGRVALDITPAISVTLSLQFWLNSTVRSTVSTGSITTAGEHGVNAPLTTWNQVIISAAALGGGAATLREVRVLDSNSALPGASTTDLAAETTARQNADSAEMTAREAADTALTTRIDGLVAAPSGDESLLDLVASTYPRDVTFTLGTRIPGGSDPGYNAGTHSLNAAGSFSETGIPTDIVTVYRVTESETIQGVQLQNRLLVGINEEAGSRRYNGEAIRWGGQLVTLTYLQRSLNNFNEYYSDVVTALSAAGQTVAFNVEDVQAEARETIPYRRWIWHHAVATTSEHISNDDFTAATASQTIAPTQHAVANYVGEADLTTDEEGILGSFAYEAAGGTIVNSTTLTAAVLGNGRVGYRNAGLLGGISPGNILIYEISERTVGSTRELTLTLGYEETGFSTGSVVIIDDTEYPFSMSASASGQTQITFVTNPSSTTAVIESGSTYAIGFKRTNGSFIEFTGSTYEPPQVIFRSSQVVGFNLRNVPIDRFPDFLDFNQDAANTARDLKMLVEERTPQEAGAFDDIVQETGTAGAANHAFLFNIREHDSNNEVRQYDHDSPDTSDLFPAGGVDFTRRLVLLIRTSLRGQRIPSKLLFWRGEGAQQTLDLTLRVVLNTGAFAADPLTVYYTQGLPTALAVGDEVSINVEYSDGTRLHAPNPEAFNERTLTKSGAQTWLGIAQNPQGQQALDYDYISSHRFDQDIDIAAVSTVTYTNLQAVPVPQTPQVANAVRVRFTFTQTDSQPGTAVIAYRLGSNYYTLTDTENRSITFSESGSFDLFLSEDYFDDTVLRLAVSEPSNGALQFTYSATYDFYQSAESLKRSILHRLINPGVQHTLTRNAFSVTPANATENVLGFVQPFRLSELEYITMELSIVNANNAATERHTYTIYGNSLRRMGAINIADSTEISNWPTDSNNHRTVIPGWPFPQQAQIEGVTSAKMTELLTNSSHNGVPILMFAFRLSGAFIVGLQTISWTNSGTDFRIGATHALVRQ